MLQSQLCVLLLRGLLFLLHQRNVFHEFLQVLFALLDFLLQPRLLGTELVQLLRQRIHGLHSVPGGQLQFDQFLVLLFDALQELLVLNLQLIKINGVQHFAHVFSLLQLMFVFGNLRLESLGFQLQFGHVCVLEFESLIQISNDLLRIQLLVPHNVASKLIHISACLLDPQFCLLHAGPDRLLILLHDLDFLLLFLLQPIHFCGGNLNLPLNLQEHILLRTTAPAATTFALLPGHCSGRCVAGANAAVGDFRDHVLLI
mmetsp:Transcript_18515/g.32113  ORF Transcript_18515/g.32113 Transcript_18515/m.32113 type:complete len:258 (+) Transcript_18515:278-1051(+)